MAEWFTPNKLATLETIQVAQDDLDFWKMMAEKYKGRKCSVLLSQLEMLHSESYSRLYHEKTKLERQEKAVRE